MITNKFFKIIVQKEAREQETQICNEYWDIIVSEAGYRFSVAEIAKKHNLNKTDISNVASRVSTASFYCGHCKKKIKQIRLRSQINLLDYTYGDMIVHPECKHIIDGIRKHITRLETTLYTESWRKLNNAELEVLTIITQHKTRTKILQKLASLGDILGIVPIEIRDTLDLLQQMQLIWIEKDKDGNIINFHHHPDLRDKLAKYTPENFLPKIQDFYRLEFKMGINKSKYNSYHPLYSGSFKVKEMIMLHPDATYQYEAWVNDLDEIFTRITINDSLTK